MPETNSERFVPLGELHEHPANHHLNWQLPLPEYTRADELVVDTHAVNRLANWGALGKVTVQAGKRREEERPSIGGMGDDGTAAAAASMRLSRQRQKPDVQLRRIRESGAEESVPFWRDAIIKADIATVTDQLSQRGQLRQPEAWATQLNKIAWSGLRSAAIKNTGRNNLAYGIVDTIAFPASTAFLRWALDRDVGEKIPDNVMTASCVIIAGAMIVFASLREQRDEGMKSGLEQSQVPYSALPFGVDRMAIIHSVALRNRKLIRHMPGLAGGQT